MLNLLRKKKGRWAELEKSKRGNGYEEAGELIFNTPTAGWRALDYVTPKIMTDYRNNIDIIVEEFSQRIDYDEFIKGSFLDAEIDKIVDLAMRDLEHQENNHARVNESIHIIGRGDLLRYMTEYEMLLNELTDKSLVKMIKKEDEEYENNEIKKADDYRLVG